VNYYNIFFQYDGIGCINFDGNAIDCPDNVAVGVYANIEEDCFLVKEDLFGEYFELAECDENIDASTKIVYVVYNHSGERQCYERDYDSSYERYSYMNCPQHLLDGVYVTDYSEKCYLAKEDEFGEYFEPIGCKASFFEKSEIGEDNTLYELELEEYYYNYGYDEHDDWEGFEFGFEFGLYFNETNSAPENEPTRAPPGLQKMSLHTTEIAENETVTDA